MIPQLNYIFEGWELRTSHFRVVAIGKSIDRVHARSESKPYIMNPLTVSMPSAGRETAQTGTFGLLTWMGIALSCFLLICRASELWAYDSGLVHTESCLTRGNLVYKLVWNDRRQADKAEVSSRVSKSEQKRQNAVVTRERE